MFQHTPLAASLKAFKARMTLYPEDKEVTDPAKQATKIKVAIGDEGMWRLLASGLDDAQLKVPANIWQLLDDQLDVNTKITYRTHRLEFIHLTKVRTKISLTFCPTYGERLTNVISTQPN